MNIVHLPPEYTPKAEELPGDLHRIALGFEGEFPGQGVRITLALAQLFGGQYLYIRKADVFVRRWRDDSVRRRYNQGDITVKELVTMFQLSARQIFNILGSPEEVARETQPHLFGGEK